MKKEGSERDKRERVNEEGVSGRSGVVRGVGGGMWVVRWIRWERRKRGRKVKTEKEVRLEEEGR